MLARILSGGGVTDLLLESPSLQSFKILFISIILEAFPFILLGVLVSALLQVFVSDALIARLTPRNPIAGVLFGSLLGVLLPLCECGMIPVVRRLIRKGMPPYIGIVFIFAGPILNPVVFTSTYTAFRTQPSMAYSRMGLAFAVCVVLGLLLYKYMKKSPLREEKQAHMHVHNHDHPHSDKHHHAHNHRHDHEHHDHNHAHGHEHGHSHGSHNGSAVRRSWSGRLGSTLAHASDEFFDIGKYLILGAFITAFIQTILDRSMLTALSDQPGMENLFMMAFAFAVSLCSTSDAFVATSFNGIFGSGALLAFLVFGPMVDLKSTLMLLATFRTKVVLTIIAFIFAAVFIGSIIIQQFIMA
ncbi:permease [Paenibacillus oenotherae]|uniref:Permease n=2 Tax=Paenibacillus oenotherae TaxID=1435645 RepID=A0ABS7D5D2_9BACL|nr:permease [Paenibacillus oenotherae]MBW7474383.1 permease [Paenibacillus oenotherae]